ncbi:unnamed protein product, partial [Mesorhabditis spiculigera]
MEYVTAKLSTENVTFCYVFDASRQDGLRLVMECIKKTAPIRGKEVGYLIGTHHDLRDGSVMPQIDGATVAEENNLYYVQFDKNMRTADLEKEMLQEHTRKIESNVRSK